jgi:hypothetical protein
VALFSSRQHLRDDIVQLLKRIEDATRIVQRFVLGKGDVENLAAIKSAVEIWGEVKSRIEMESKMEAQERPEEDGNEWMDLKGLLCRMTDLRGLALRIGMAVDTSGLRQQNSPPAEEDTGPENLADVREAIRVAMAPAKGTGQLKWAIKPE